MGTSAGAVLSSRALELRAPDANRPLALAGTTSERAYLVERLREAVRDALDSEPAVAAPEPEEVEVEAATAPGIFFHDRSKARLSTAVEKCSSSISLEICRAPFIRSYQNDFDRPADSIQLPTVFDFDPWAEASTRRASSRPSR